MAETEAQRLLRERGGGAPPQDDDDGGSDESYPTTALVAVRTSIERVECSGAMMAYKRLQEFIDSGQYNVVLPSEAIESVSPFYSTTLSIVKLDTSPNSGMFYGHPTEDYRGKKNDKPVEFMKPNERALAKNGLTTIGDAGGIIWDTAHCMRMDDRSRPDYCEFRVVGGIRRADGSMHWVPKTRATDLEVIRQGRTRDYFDKDLKQMVHKEGVVAGNERQFLVPTTETKAYLSVIRMLFKLKQKYTLAELALPFVVPRMQFTPDYNEPAVRIWAMALGQDATAKIFGPNSGFTALPPPQTAEAEAQRQAMAGQSTSSADQTYKPERGDTVTPDSGKDIEDAVYTVNHGVELLKNADENLPEIGGPPPAEVAKPAAAAKPAEVKKPEVKPKEEKKADPPAPQAAAPPTPPPPETKAAPASPPLPPPAGPTPEQVALQEKWLQAITEAPDLVTIRQLGTAASKERGKMGGELWRVVIDTYSKREQHFVAAAQAQAKAQA